MGSGCLPQQSLMLSLRGITSLTFITSKSPPTQIEIQIFHPNPCRGRHPMTLSWIHQDLAPVPVSHLNGISVTCSQRWTLTTTLTEPSHIVWSTLATTDLRLQHGSLCSLNQANCHQHWHACPLHLNYLPTQVSRLSFCFYFDFFAFPPHSTFNPFCAPSKSPARWTDSGVLLPGRECLFAGPRAPAGSVDRHAAAHARSLGARRAIRDCPAQVGHSSHSRTGAVQGPARSPQNQHNPVSRRWLPKMVALLSHTARRFVSRHRPFGNILHMLDYDAQAASYSHNQTLGVCQPCCVASDRNDRLPFITPAHGHRRMVNVPTARLWLSCGMPAIGLYLPQLTSV